MCDVNEGAFAERPKLRSDACIRIKSVPGRGNNTYKGSEARGNVACSGSRKMFIMQFRGDGKGVSPDQARSFACRAS